MMDRFKFRVWNKIEKTYSDIPYGSYALSDSGELFWIESNCDCSETNTEDYIIEQCTGLRDKNGKPIFEGDILDNDFLVVWKYLGWCFKAIRVRDSIPIPFSLDMTEFEVTGNVHENEELLK